MSWPPDDFSEYVGTESFRRRASELASRLSATMPTQLARDAVFDAAVDVVLRVLDGKLGEDAFPSERAFWAYVKRTSRRRVLDRTSRRDWKDVSLGSLTRPPTEEQELLPDESAASREILESVLGASDEETRETVQLWLDGLDTGEIASEMEVSVRWVQRRLRVFRLELERAARD